MPRGLTVRRRLAGAAVAVVGLPLLTAVVLANSRGALNGPATCSAIWSPWWSSHWSAALFSRRDRGCVGLAHQLLLHPAHPSLDHFERNNVFALTAFVVVAAVG